MRVNDQPPGQFVAFWRRIKPRQQEEASAAWQEATRAAIGRLPDEVIDILIDDWRRAYEEAEATRSSVNSRATSLLLVVGILNGLAALTATTIAGAQLVLGLLYVLVAFVLGFFAVGTAVLAIRAQQVATWSQPHVRPDEVTGPRQLRIRRAVEFYSAARLNRHVLQDVVGYLRDAQTYAFVTVALLATLTVVAAVTSVTKSLPSTVAPSAPVASPVATPTPVLSPAPTPQATPRPTSSPQPLSPSSPAPSPS